MGLGTIDMKVVRSLEVYEGMRQVGAITIYSNGATILSWEGFQAPNHVPRIGETGRKYCGVCKLGLGFFTTHCPGRKLTVTEFDQVTSRNIDYSDGHWVRRV